MLNKKENPEAIEVYKRDIVYLFITLSFHMHTKESNAKKLDLYCCFSCQNHILTSNKDRKLKLHCKSRTHVT